MYNYIPITLVHFDIDIGKGLAQEWIRNLPKIKILLLHKTSLNKISE